MSSVLKSPGTVITSETTLAAAVLGYSLLAGPKGLAVPLERALGPSQAFDDVREQGAHGVVLCRATENGAPAPATVTIRNGGAEVAKGTCGRAIHVSPGRYSVVVRLDGALDRPEQSDEVEVRAGHPARVEAEFHTGILEILVEADGKPVAALATILRGGQPVCTLGSGVPGHLSVGAYDLVVTRGGEKRKVADVQVQKAQKRTVRISF